jgi:ABC-2 type transport system ATP-binding protein
VLELIGVTKSYGDIVALDHLDMLVPPGELFGFLGPNGAGKTTAMRTVFGISHPDEGSVRWMGAPIGPDQRRRFGYLPEERGLYPGMKVGEQLEYLAALHGLTQGDARTEARAWLTRLGLVDRWTDKVEALSLGNQQRVQLAAALVHRPELLILDEPFSGLDPVGVSTMGAVLAEQAAAGVAVLFSSHQLDLVEQYCQRVAIIDRGRLVAGGAVADLTQTDPPVLEVSVEAPPSWASTLAGVTVASTDAGSVRLLLAPGTDAQEVLRAAMNAGRVTMFRFTRRRLSEVFLDAVRAR